MSVWGVNNVLVDDLVSEEGCDNGKEPCDELVVSDYMRGNSGNGKELKRKIFDRCFGFTVH